MAAGIQVAELSYFGFAQFDTFFRSTAAVGVRGCCVPNPTTHHTVHPPPISPGALRARVDEVSAMLAAPTAPRPRGDPPPLQMEGGALVITGEAPSRPAPRSHLHASFVTRDRLLPNGWWALEQRAHEHMDRLPPNNTPAIYYLGTRSQGLGGIIWRFISRIDSKIPKSHFFGIF